MSSHPPLSLSLSLSLSLALSRHITASRIFKAVALSKQAHNSLFTHTDLQAWVPDLRVVGPRSISTRINLRGVFLI